MRQTKANLIEIINTQRDVSKGQLDVIDQLAERVKALETEKREIQTAHSREVRKLSEKIKDLEYTIKNHRGRVAKALDAAEEGSHAAGLISRITYRLLEENDSLRRQER